MAKLIYSRNGSETTESISNASPMIQAIWNQAHSFGANIVRVRAEKNRFGTDTGRTFNSFIMVEYQSTSKKTKCMKVMPYTLLERYLLPK